MCHGSMIFLQEGKEATEVQEANLGVWILKIIVIES